MLPFFVLRSFVERTPARWLQTGALALGSAVQLGLFYGADSARGYHIAPDVLACVLFVRHVVLPLMGPIAAMRHARDVRAVIEAGGVPWATIMACVVVIGGLTLASLRKWREAPAWLLIPGLALAAISYFGAIHGGAALLAVDWATRYSFVPQVLIGFTLLAFATTHTGRIAQGYAAAAAWIVVVGASSYFQPLRILADGPDWRSEVAAWRADPEHRLASWPMGAWRIDLAPTTAVCSSDPNAKDPPDFCDQYWEKM
jgi:hypothetical protein